VVRPELVQAPAELSAVDTTGAMALTARAGVTGTITASSPGLVGATPTGFVLRTGSFDPREPQADESTSSTTFDVAAHTSLARFEVRTPSVGDDLDLYVYRDGDLVTTSTAPTGDETVTLSDPTPGSYTVFVHARSALGGVTLGSLTGWVVGRSGGPTDDTEVIEPLGLRPSPVAVTGGRPFGIELSWSRLDPSMRWLAVVSYDDASRRTFLTVN
jgi:hypothetical protein